EVMAGTRMEPFCRGRGAGEEAEVEVVCRGFPERDAVVVRPESRVALAISPIVLAGEGLTRERVTTAKPPDVTTVDRSPVHRTTRFGLKQRHLAGGQVTIAAAGREEEFDDWSSHGLEQP